MKQTIINIIKQKHDSSGGHCGIHLPDLAEQSKTDISTVKKILNELKNDGLIVKKETAKGYIAMLKVGKDT